MTRRYASMCERILANTVIEGDCWIWIGTRNANGYGRISVRECGQHRKKLAHRIAYVAFIGPLPDDVELGHAEDCLSRACVNPGHVAPITRSENVAQVWRKKKTAPKAKGGEAIGAAKTGTRRG